MNPNSYFLNAGKKYYPKFDSQGNLKSGSNPILAFSVSKIEENGNNYVQVISSGISYKPKKELQKEIITINEVQTTNINTYNPNAAGGTPSSYGTEKKYGDYHLYQPISLLGYQADLDLEIPNLTSIPAFLFYYAVDYDKLKDFDAAINFAIQITTDLALFYFTGGVSTLKHLSYLKYIYNFRKGMVATDAVLVWRGIDAAAETVAVTSGVLTAYFNYEATVSNDPRLKDLYKKLSMFFLALTLGTAGGAVYARVKTVKAADEVLAEINRLTNVGISHNLPNDILSVLYTVRNISTVSKTFFQNRISSLVVNDLGESNHIYNFYENLSDIEKSNFWMDFNKYVGDASQNSTNWGKTDLDFWRLMNKTEGAYEGARMKAWIEAPQRFKLLRREMNLLNEVVKLRITDREAYEHLAFFANRPKSGTPSNSFNVTGGHKFALTMSGNTEHIVVDNAIEILDSKFIHIIDNSKVTSQKMVDYLGNTGNINYSKTAKPGGHFEHKNILIKKNPQPINPDPNRDFILNNIVYERKSRHTQLNPSWGENDIIYEYSYALSKKKQISTAYQSTGMHGQNNMLHITTEYEGEMLNNGIKLYIKNENFFRYNEQPLIHNHYKYFELKF